MTALRDAVQQLQLEAKELDKVGKMEHEPTFNRPHPLVKAIPSSAADAVVNRMLGNFTGNDYRDTYVRWHLMEVIKRADDAQIKAMGDRLIQLLKRNPDLLTPDFMDEQRDEPPDIAARWHQLHRQTVIVEGYPPFQRTYHGEKALARATGAEKQRIAPLVAEMNKLRPLWNRIVDQDAVAFNRRIGNLNFALRQYRGELVYEALRSRDGQAISQVIDEVARQVKNNQHLGFDLVAYMYMAFFNGFFNDVDRAAMMEAGEQLLRAARGTEGFKQYLNGKAEPTWAVRNFADYAFHLVHLMQRPDEFPTSIRAEPPRRITGQLPPLTADESLSLERVQAAIDRGITALYALEPEYALRRPSHYRAAAMESARFAHEMGHQALSVWALRALGEPVPRMNLYRRMSWVLSRDQPHVYDRSMRASMLAQMPPSFWAPWTRRDQLWLREAMTDAGSFEATWRGKNVKSIGDNTNAFYGLMGMWAAARVGQAAPHEDWKLMNEYWLGGQLSNGAWGLTSAQKDAQKGKGGEVKPNPVMTAAGITALTITQRYMAETNPSYKPGAAERAAIDKGLAWLDQRFDINDPGIEEDWYFYMWIIQQVGHASGYRSFNKVDWHEAVTREILNRQLANGQWESPQDPLVSTSFALLYLSQANATVGVAKLQYDGNWNNRPQDIYHFTRYAADLYETPIVWQVVSADLPGDKLLDAPILWLSADGAIKLPDRQLQHLRDYIKGGGLLVVNQEKSDAAVTQSVRQLTASLFGPDAKLDAVPADHPLYTIHAALNPSARMMMVDNGIRPQMILLPADMGGDLQDDRVAKDAFGLLSNMLLYVKGRQTTSGRLEKNVVVPRQFTPRAALKAARIDLGPGSDPEPAALEQLQAILGNNHQVRLEVSKVEPKALTSDIKVAFVAVTAPLQWTDADLEAIRRWVDDGGTLWMDAAGGNKPAFDRLGELVRALEPDQALQPLPPNSPIVTGPSSGAGGRTSSASRLNAQRVIYRRYVLWGGLAGLRTPRLQMIPRGDRPAIIFSGDDLTAGLAGLDHWQIYGYVPASARALVVNGMLSLATPVAAAPASAPATTPEKKRK